MKVRELKTLVVELTKGIQLEANSAQAIVTALSVCEDESDVTDKTMVPVKFIIEEFWNWVTINVPYEKWQNSAEITPWLTLQRALVKPGLLPVDFHHPILYPVLIAKYNQQDNNQLSITDLMPLLSYCSRILGYVEINEIAEYPVSPLNKKINFRRAHEVTRLQEIICLLRTIFYLTYHYCSAEQMTLMPFLIHFRTSTTDEERRSELAIFNWLSKKILECLDFFHKNENYINRNSLNTIPFLQKVAHLIPTSHNDFIKATLKRPWIPSFIEKTKEAYNNSKHNLLICTLNLLHIDFATRKDPSYRAALDFAATSRIQLLNNNEIPLAQVQLANSAITLFCLTQYIKLRKTDPRNKYSFLSPGKNAKLRAAQKQQDAICGKLVEFTIFEKIALKQGRLKQLVDIQQNTATILRSGYEK